MKDVIIKPDGPKTLLLDKHADYIAAYGSKNDDYVSTILNFFIIRKFLVYFLLFPRHVLALLKMTLNRFKC